MRHAKKHICSITWSNDQLKAYAELLKHSDLLLFINNKGEIEEAFSKDPATIRQRHKVAAGLRLKALRTYGAVRIGEGKKLSTARWKHRVIARIARCPEELFVALHSGLVDSIEL